MSTQFIPTLWDVAIKANRFQVEPIYGGHGYYVYLDGKEIHGVTDIKIDMPLDEPVKITLTLIDGKEVTK